MQRRTILSMLGLALVGARSQAEAQQAGKLHRIGFLWDTPQVWPHALEAFRQGLRDLGWIEGQNIVIEYRWAEGQFDRLPGLVEDLVRLKVDLIVAPTSIYTGAAKRVTSTVPLVFASHADPVNSGHVVSLARPGSNATGLTIIMSETMAKSLELLKEALPGLSRVAVIWDPGTPSHTPALKAVETAGSALRLRVQTLGVRSVAEFDGAFSAAARERAGAVLVLSTPLYMGGAKQLAQLGLARSLPTMFGPREHVEAGGLMSYSPDRADLLSASRRLCRQDPERRQSSGTPRAAGHEVRVGRQSQDRQGARPDPFADGARPGQPDHRMTERDLSDAIPGVELHAAADHGLASALGR